MKRAGIFVGEHGNIRCFRELLDDLRTRYSVDVFQPKTYNTPLLHGRLNRWSFLHGIRSLLRRSDVAFFEWASELLEPATKLPKFCPIVTRLHAYELYAWGPRVNWKAVDKVILVSEAMRRNFIEEHPEHAAKAVVLPNAVRLDVFRPPEKRVAGLNLGMLGAFYPRKRIYETILMFAKLHEQKPTARLHLGGGRIHAPDSDEYYLACRRLVGRFGLTDAVEFHDDVPSPAQWLQQIDVFISNSFWEGQQAALLEAMACGCHCLSHAWQGAEEVLPSELLCATDDDLLQKTLCYADLPPAGRRTCHDRMRRIACERFDIERQKVTFREILHSTLAAAY